MAKIYGFFEAMPAWIAGLDDRGVTVVIVCLVAAVVVGSVLFIRLGSGGR